MRRRLLNALIAAGTLAALEQEAHGAIDCEGQCPGLCTSPTLPDLYADAYNPGEHFKLYGFSPSTIAETSADAHSGTTSLDVSLEATGWWCAARDQLSYDALWDKGCLHNFSGWTYLRLWVKGVSGEYDRASLRFAEQEVRSGALVKISTYLPFLSMSTTEWREATISRSLFQDADFDMASADVFFFECDGIPQIVTMRFYADDIRFSDTSFADVIEVAADRHDDGTVRVRWETAYEVENLGFHVLRRQGRSLERLTPALVAGSALLAANPATPLSGGRSYVFQDNAPAGGEGARYFVETIDLDGMRERHGPAVPAPVHGPAPAGSSPTLGQLGRAPQGALAAGAAASSGGAGALPPVPPIVPGVIVRPRTGRCLGGPPEDLQRALAGQPALKLAVREDGWHRVGQPELAAAGLDPAIDPRTLRMFVDGREQPMAVAGEEDGRLDPIEGIEFRGRGVDTPSTDTRIYWLVADGCRGVRVPVETGTARIAAGPSFRRDAVRRDRTLYFAALRNGEADNFFGPAIAGEPVDVALALHHLDPDAAEPPVLEVLVRGVTAGPHRVAVSWNGVEAGVAEFTGSSPGRLRVPVPAGRLLEGDNAVRLASLGGADDVSLVDSLRLTHAHLFVAEDGTSLACSAPGGTGVTIDGFDSASIRVVDITDDRAPVELRGPVGRSAGGGWAVTVAVPGAGDRRLIAFTPAGAARPAAVTPNGWRLMRPTARRRAARCSTTWAAANCWSTSTATARSAAGRRSACCRRPTSRRSATPGDSRWLSA